ncbi:MAG: hypothetical protein GTO22_21925 [Gemmatimonadales bacterium]|nr:hypothetical protein [Gemmatimonadales bacterium]
MERCGTDYRLYDDRGMLIGTIRAPRGYPLLGHHAATYLLQREALVQSNPEKASEVEEMNWRGHTAA